jgi:hypothetical protein
LFFFRAGGGFAPRCDDEQNDEDSGRVEHADIVGISNADSSCFA